MGSWCLKHFSSIEFLSYLLVFTVIRKSHSLCRLCTSFTQSQMKRKQDLKDFQFLKAKLVHLLTDYVPITESVNTNK